MGRENENEMERIRRGLEAFLEQELEEEQDGGDGRTVFGGRSERTGEEQGGGDGRTVLGGESERTGEEQDGGDRRTAFGGRSERTGEEQGGGDGRTVFGGRSRQEAKGKQETGVKADQRRREKATDNKRRTKKRKKFRLRRLLLLLAVVAALLGAALYALVGSMYDRLNYVEVDSVAGLPMAEDGVVNILLIGNDSRKNEDDGRSDAMILLSVSSRTKTIYMISLLRDMYVEIPGHKDNRLNAAYSFGGAELLMETVEKNFDIPVNRYVQVNFEAFVGMVDSVGGVDLELTEKEIEYVNGYLVEYNMLTDRPQGTDNMDTDASGMVHLNGPQALAYCRNRYLGTDFGRTERQRKVLTEVIKKIPSALITDGAALLDALLPNLTTNLTKNECFRLSLMAGKALTYDITADSIPQPGAYKNATIRKMAVLEVDFEANRQYLKDKLYGEERQE